MALTSKLSSTEHLDLEDKCDQKQLSAVNFSDSEISLSHIAALSVLPFFFLFVFIFYSNTVTATKIAKAVTL